MSVREDRDINDINVADLWVQALIRLKIYRERGDDEKKCLMNISGNIFRKGKPDNQIDSKEGKLFVLSFAWKI